MTVASHGNLIDYHDRETWLKGRTAGIGASEVAILFGLAPESWGSPMSLWLEKTGRQVPEERDGEWLEIGQLLEDDVAELYQRRTKRTLWSGGGPFVVAQHPRLSFLRCTPDRWVVDAPRMPGNGNLQCKNVGMYVPHDWNDGIPEHVVMQTQTEIACMDVAWGSAAALVGGNSFKWFDQKRDDALIAEIEAQVSWFWKLVMDDVPPPMDSSEATSRALRRLYPNDNEQEVVLPPSSEGWIAQWLDAKARLKVVKDEQDALRDEAENAFLAAMGAATYGVLPDGRRVTLRTTTREGYAIEPTKYRQLRIESVKKQGKKK